MKSTRISSQKLYNMESKRLFLIGPLITLFIIVMASIIVRFLKRSTREIINKLDTISNGDLEVKVNIDETNEFGIMKKSLAKTINNLADMIESIKEGSKDVGSNSRNGPRGSRTGGRFNADKYKPWRV